MILFQNTQMCFSLSTRNQGYIKLPLIRGLAHKTKLQTNNEIVVCDRALLSVPVYLAIRHLVREKPSKG